MSEDTTTTEAPVSEGGDAPVDSAAPQPEQTEQAEAEVSTESTTTEPTETPSEQEGDFDANKWAQAKGLDLNNPTDVAKLAKNAREAEKKMHESTQQASELKGVINEEASRLGVPNDQVAALQQQVQIMQANSLVNEFYTKNPDAQKYDAKMAEIAREKGIGDIDALYAMAKVQDLQNGGEDQLKSEGKKEGLQDLALKQKVASATASATSAQTSTPGVTREDVQRALADHDVSWLKKNQAAIDAL